MAIIRQEINILDNNLTDSSGNIAGHVLLDTTKYSGSVSYYFEIIVMFYFNNSYRE